MQFAVLPADNSLSLRLKQKHEHHKECALHKQSRAWLGNAPKAPCQRGIAKLLKIVVLLPAQIEELAHNKLNMNDSYQVIV